ncbi:ABC transporter substrate-binding protein [Pelagovum pacificum]|uniref:ABC transporter substrate-binding protein n=2 Tax=Pelagovum pacificum TaxID=2588711 RepID=A0A5C5GKZ4_9RHOB|nr:ABC transporter substrate-binding protein [Pelagovum pacificum]TNY34399.1 ABC transporter substrate-binding protein [Pelagovum pacificum]
MSRAAPAALLIGVAAPAMAQVVEPTAPPEPPPFSAQGEPNFVNRDEIFTYRSLDSYSQPEYMDAFVENGTLPPVEERLPTEPMVYETSNMVDGAGVYGDTMRHVIGGRPEGWNYWGGQVTGWGGIDIGLFECLTRTGPLFTLNADSLEPLPNLAKSWEWSDDGMELTVSLIEGAKWSDGDPFDSEDVMFYWDHIVQDPEVQPLNGATPETFGQGTTLEKVDDYTVKFTFTTERPEQVLYSMAYGTFCPGPSHILAPEHPANNPDNSYEDFRNAFPPEYMNFPVMGGWVPVEYRADDIVVMRRNPYYWKVDSDGNQLPYLNEMQYRLSTWADRDVQAVAGTGDFSNLEQAENFVESLRRAAEDDAPARLEFGPRIIGYSLYMNFSGNGWGEPDDRQQAVRELNRNLEFRQGVTQALDRVRLGESLVKGPFTSQYPGGLYAGTTFYDKDSTVFYPYSLESAAAHFEAAGLEDTDGNGFYNWPEGSPAGDGDVTITLLANTDYQTDRNLAEAVVAMMEEAGIKLSLNLMSGNDRDATRDSGRYDWRVERNASDLITVVQNTAQLAPTGPRTSSVHFANDDGELDLMPFEEEMVDAVNGFMATNDSEERAELMKTYQQLYTENLYGIGLTNYPGALIINKRFDNIPSGAPIFMYNWAEDNIIRERVFVPEADQMDTELYPDAIPGEPGSDGPVTAG